eukprot:scaffold138328_cov55-Attheya_sp.AAC.1
MGTPDAGVAPSAASSQSSSSSKKTQTLPPIPPNAHRFVLMRHGESELNNANIFTGWRDVALTQRGVVESIETGQRALEAGGISYTPLEYDWRFAERHYGAFQGLSKEQTVARLGREHVQKYRRSFTAKPPLMTLEHPHYENIINDPSYRNLKGIPLGESLQDCQKRVVVPLEVIVKEVSTSTNSQSESDYSLVVAHNNTLRALVMHLDDIPVDDIESFSIPTAIPFYYDIDKATGKVVSTSACIKNFRGRAVNDPWMWALHDHQVTNIMLVTDDDTENEGDISESDEGMEGLVADAKHTTELFSSSFGSAAVKCKESAVSKIRKVIAAVHHGAMMVHDRCIDWGSALTS